MLFYAVNFFLKFCNIKQNLGINSTFRWNVGIVTMSRASVWYHLSAHGPFRSACFARWLDRVQLNSLSSEISSNGESTSQFHFHLRYLAMQLEFNQFDLPALLTLCEKYCVCRDFFDKLSSAIFSNPIWPASPLFIFVRKMSKGTLEDSFVIFCWRIDQQTVQSKFLRRGGLSQHLSIQFSGAQQVFDGWWEIWSLVNWGMKWNRYGRRWGSDLVTKPEW